ncbi:Uma2 family endonuclease [Neorhodopirellula pilleata]|uniref:Putative restriction endonuclease domain-containing protein n=1 Tax=Neorhodopirellula pilleata TaxID=2714738 RepID=A0A5C6A1J6_9BACT|nr:Uma2 family endonuclease [Neorhodopirellula pilleata]TWT93714.1 hypothetical protein Pla100_42320 [Neorhodopirellula pilleata]
MSTATSFASELAMPLPIHRFSVQQYHQLGELGVLKPEDRVELLEGWIVEKMNQRPIHGFAVRYLDQWLQAFCLVGHMLQCQLPITTESSEPEPDLAVVKGQNSDYRERYPNGSECRLVIEVADTSLAKDRAKASIYATSGVQEYWIVNLVDNQLECYSDSDAVRYQTQTTLTAGQTKETQISDTLIRLELDKLLG